MIRPGDLEKGSGTLTSPTREAIVTEIGKHRVSAILRTDNEETAARAMDAAVEGGFRMVEFTLTTPGAWDEIERER